MNFEINLLFLIKSFFPHDQKIMIKPKNLEREKGFVDKIKSIIQQF